MPEVKDHGSSKRRILRKARKYLLHYVLLAAFCLAIVFVMCYTVFFKLNKIQITGCSVYSEQQIIDEIGAQKGESLFKINISNAEKTLRGKLPYIRSVKISRKFPTTLMVEIEEEEVLGAVYTSQGFALLSTTGKVLETGVLTLPDSTPRVVGLPMETVYDTGSYLRQESGSDALLPQLVSLQEISAQLKANHFDDITYYDVSDMLNIQVMIEDRLLLMLGSDNDIDYKISFIREVLDAKSNGDEQFEDVPEEGTLDFSNPPALHTMSISIDKVKNPDAYLDFGANLPQQGGDNVGGGQESEPLPQPEEPTAEEGEEGTEEQSSSQEAESSTTGGEAAGQEAPVETEQTQPSSAEQDSAGQASTNQTADETQQQNAASSNGGINQTGGMNENPAALGGQAVQPSEGTSEGAEESQAPQSQQASGQNQDRSGDTQPDQGESGGAFNAPSKAPIVNE